MIKLISHKTIIKVNGITLEQLEIDKMKSNIKHISTPLKEIQREYEARKHEEPENESNEKI